MSKIESVIVAGDDEAKSTDLHDLVRKAKLRDSLAKGYAAKGAARGGVCGHSECNAEARWITKRAGVQAESARAFMLAHSRTKEGKFVCFFADSNPDIHP